MGTPSIWSSYLQLDLEDSSYGKIAEIQPDLAEVQITPKTKLILRVGELDPKLKYFENYVKPFIHEGMTSEQICSWIQQRFGIKSDPSWIQELRNKGYL